MSREINLTYSLAVNNTGLQDAFSKSLTMDQAARGVFENTITLSTTPGNLSFGNLTAPGIIVLQNLDSTNSIHYGDSSGHAVHTLLPGDIHIGRMKASTNCNVVASAGTPQLFYKVLES